MFKTYLMDNKIWNVVDIKDYTDYDMLEEEIKRIKEFYGDRGSDYDLAYDNIIEQYTDEFFVLENNGKVIEIDAKKIDYELVG